MERDEEVGDRGREVEEDLFDNAMTGDWEKVVGLYRSSENVHDLRITKMGDTALHIAAFDGETKIVLDLLEIIKENASKILQIKNKKGNTPLHLAAKVGDVETCHAMATKDRKLVSLRNDQDETPLFLAALNGHDKVFLCLHSHCEEGCYSFRARNGDTILHAAMSGEYFSLIAEELKGQEVDKKICPHGKKGRNIDNWDSESQELTIWSIDKIQDEKRRHIWATQVMNLLIEHSNLYENVVQNPGGDPEHKDKFAAVPDPIELEKKDKLEVKKQTPILIAAKMGVSEMVEKNPKKFPVAIHDVDSENKNVALLAVENRQPHVYSLLVDRKKQITSLLRQVDKNGNNALHLAAKSGSHRPWNSPGSALQMQWELKWYTFVKNSMPPRSSLRYNKEGETPQQIFATSHKYLHKEGSNWLAKTSESCSVVAALIATVSFATSATVPGGLNDRTGSPVLEDKPAFNAFTISSLLSLCLSLTALALFYSIITSRFKVQEFSNSLPRKLLLGLTSLFASIASALVSFCTGHMFLLNRQLKHLAYPLYATTSIPITIFALSLLPLYSDLLQGIFTKVPQHNQME